jgi:hypothetical protein
MKKSTLRCWVTFCFVALSLVSLAQSEPAQPIIPLKTPNSVSYGSDVIINDMPTQDQRHACLSVAFNGWLYAGYGYADGTTHEWMIMQSKDDGATWSVLREQPLSADWYVVALDIVICGTTGPNLKLFVSRVLQNDVSGYSELIISELDGNSGGTNHTLWDKLVSGGEVFRDVAIASDYLFPAVGASPYSIAALYSRSLPARDSVVLLLSEDGGASVTDVLPVTSTLEYTRHLSLAYGRCHNYFNGRYHAAWEQRGTSSDDLCKIYTAHTNPHIYDPFTAPYRLDDLLTSTAGFARNPSICCQFNDLDNGMSNYTEVVLFDRAYNGTVTDFDVVGVYNKEAANTDNWFIFGMNSSYLTSDVQPDINYDPVYNNFLATYCDLTNQKLRYLVKEREMSDPYNWIVISDQYNSATNLLSPYPKVEINFVYQQVAHVWNAEGPGSVGVSMFDAEYSSVGINPSPGRDQSPAVFPNPASTRVTFRCTLTEPGTLDISISDLQGAEVMNAVHMTCGAGEQVISADVSALTPGVYLYRSTTGGQTSTGRIVIIR